MLLWLDQGGALAGWLKASRRTLEVIGTEAGAVTDALLAAPWEILADGTGFLATDRMNLFLPLRRIGPEGTPAAPNHSDLAMLFMAAAPEGQHELDYEAEETAILEATRNRSSGRPLAHLTVEESGELAVLADRHRDDGPFDILHLSCHGDILRVAGVARPVLLLETETGAAETVTPDRLLAALGERVPALLFLSACRTGQRGPAGELAAAREGRREGSASFDAAPRRDAGGAPAPDLTEPLARQMAAGVPHVLGWDGSVYDADASAFAEALYAGLSRGETVAYAAARARHGVMEPMASGAPRRHWHLVRLYLGPGGGGTLCEPRKPARTALPPAAPRFLDAAKQVRVAGRHEFVGRRRQLQHLRRGFAGAATGALIHGMGNLGKSSLAARLADRMSGHQLAVVFGRYDGLSILMELERVATPLLGRVFQGFAAQARFRNEFAAMREAVRADEAMLGEAMNFLLDQVFAAYPVLLVIDDFERALEEPVPDRPLVMPRPDLRPALGALLAAFAAHRGQSRLLITSRYDFVLPDGAGNDLAAGLLRVPLVGMRQGERQKQWRAKARAGAAEERLGKEDMAQVSAALEAAAGNPGLQDILTRPILKGEAEAAPAAVEAVSQWRATGEVPADGNAAVAFFTRMSFETYAAALTGTERLMLAAACLFEEEVPVPRAAVAAAGGALGVVAVEPTIDRLIALGLFDDFGTLSGWPGTPELPHLGANPLARPLAPSLEEDLAAQVADAGLAVLATAWRDTDGDFPLDPRGPVACRLALRATSPDPDILQAAALAGVLYLFKFQGLAREALELAVPAVLRLKAMGRLPDHLLAGHTVTAAEQAGDVELQEKLLELALSSETLSEGPRAQLLGLRANLLEARGDLDEALRIRIEELLPIFEALGDRRSLAVTKGNIADVLEARGDLDEALRIRIEELLPIFEALGDRRSLAVTKGNIADVLEARGDLDEALRIRIEELLPIFEALGDRRSLAVTKGNIADVLEARGDLDEALRIRIEELLPIFEALGDRRSLAVTKGNIADVLEARGDLDEALRIRIEDEIPVYEALGDRLSLALTKGKIADVLEARGDLDEALRIRTEELLPVFEALGDRRSLALTKGKIADVLEARGDLDEALRIRTEELLPVFEALGDRLSLALTKGKIADVLEARGDLDEALRIRIEELLPVFEALGDRRSLALTKGNIADVLEARGDLDEALRIRIEELLPVFEALGDRRSLALTKGKIADVLEARGDLDEALRIRIEELLPVFDALGDRRSLALTKGKIADVLEARGDLDEALRIRTEELLPVFAALGDRRSLALTKGKIADVLEARGDLDEALRIRVEEQLPVFEALGDKRELAVTKGQIADVLEARGDLDEALRIRVEEQLPAYEVLGDKRSLAVTRGKIADAFAEKGDVESALAMHLSRLPDAEAMGDLSILVHIRFSCARLRLERGDHQTDGLEAIAEDLAWAWDGANRLGYPDAVGAIGTLFGQVLALGGLPDQGIGILTVAAAAWDKLGQAGQADHCRQIIAKLKEQNA
ncbi:hypothetical protein BJF92_07055 [Rhizobium rhizosphaerae]|uniref:CHAT domain-containing protein n=1 Tax=Xaviernesmea rhizosphaerae TaxID=1672749 RepID=A0A1Q9ACY6_9HYPH|nr:CHAT domain-containing protein [Xaviernesmea rhizosphaerae]OLP52765.1 hypothetical protein BJF92_07055 [Xaviernesmea rhizosphaerae]